MALPPQVVSNRRRAQGNCLEPACRLSFPFRKRRGDHITPMSLLKS
jgi:hypothetical protein